MSGYSRTARVCSATSPNSTSRRLSTVAKTGRRMQSSEMFTGSPCGPRPPCRCRPPCPRRPTPVRRPWSWPRAPVRCRGRRRRCVVTLRRGFGDQRAVTHALRALEDHAFAVLQPGEHCDAARHAPTGTHLAARGAAVGDHVDVGLALLGHQRFFRQHQGRRLAALHVHRHEHARSQHAVGVRQLGAHRDRARHRVDARADRRDLAREHAVRQALDGRLHGKAPHQLAEERLRHGELELDDGGVVERRDDGARVDEAAEADAPEARAPVERRADDRVVGARARRRDPRLAGLHRGLELVELGARQRLRDRQVAAAVELVAALGEIRLRFRELRRRRGAVELDQHGAATHALAFLEPDRGDGVGHLGGDLDRLVRERGADRLELHAERAPLGHRGHHRNYGIAAAHRTVTYAAATHQRFRGVRAAPGDQQDAEQGQDRDTGQEGPWDISGTVRPGSIG